MYKKNPYYLFIQLQRAKTLRAVRLICGDMQWFTRLELSAALSLGGRVGWGCVIQRSVSEGGGERERERLGVYRVDKTTKSFLPTRLGGILFNNKHLLACFLRVQNYVRLKICNFERCTNVSTRYIHPSSFFIFLSTVYLNFS